jgi:transposase
MSDGIGLVEVLLGLPGFRVLDVVEDGSEVVIRVETTATRVFCRTCGVRAEPQDRMRIDVRDLACFGRPARLVWNKRRWRCREPLCAAKTWTETSEHVDAQAVLTRRAGIEACRQVGENARPVSQLADALRGPSDHAAYIEPRTLPLSATLTRPGSTTPPASDDP